jgi:hypothetical protein
MPDINAVTEAAVAAAGTVTGSKAVGWAGEKLLGPVFDEMGQALRERYSDRRKRNFERMGRNAEKKLGPAVDEPGEVSPRVALKVLEDGSLCDGEVMAEYFGGILAGSRTPNGDDDRGATWASLVSRLATADVHLHYLIYQAFRHLYLGQTTIDLANAAIRETHRIYIGASDIVEAMGIDPANGWERVIVPAMSALVREGLVGGQYAYVAADILQQQFSIDTSEPGIIVPPSVPGLELFLWAFNYGRLPVHVALIPELQFVSQEGLKSVTRPRIVGEMVSERSVRLQQEVIAEQARQAEAANQGVHGVIERPTDIE